MACRMVGKGAQRDCGKERSSRCAFAHPTSSTWSCRLASAQQRVDIAGIGLIRQRREPAPDLPGALPFAVREGLALAERRVVAPIAERRAALDAGCREVALNGG